MKEDIVKPSYNGLGNDFQGIGMTHILVILCWNLFLMISYFGENVD